MTKDYAVLAQIAFDLQDASEELSKIIEMIRPPDEIDEDEFNVRMAHLYSHLNAAWNVRNTTGDALEFADKRQRNSWKRFPEDLQPL